MKYFKNILNNKELLLVAVFVLISALLHLRQIDFPCINSDEASFAYNAFSISETARDEYGSFMPYRFLAFGENKLPVTIYAIVPFIALFGMNDLTVRLPFILIGIFSPCLFYILGKKLFQNKSIAIIASFLASISPWIQILSRHIHEDTLMLVITICVLLLMVRLHEQLKTQTILLLATLSGVGLFTYHIGKFLTVFVLGWMIYLSIKQKTSLKSITKYVFIISLPIIIFLMSELFHPSTRVGNLLFTSNQGFTLQIEQLRKEHDLRLLHNKLTHAATVLTNQYLLYFSPEFLVTEGDANLRFGAKGISPITAVEYLFVCIGLYYVFKRQEQYRYLIISLLLTAPFTASLSWQTQSLTRSYLMIIPLITISSYGMYHSICAVKKQHRFMYGVVVAGGLIFFSFFSWDYYFNHYTKNPDVVSSWQCGYKELGSIIRSQYDNYDQFIITKKLGQPYIFMLYFLRFPPENYQHQAQLSSLDEYGFGQVEQFDKFQFSFSSPIVRRNKTLYVGVPEDFNESGINKNDVSSISVQGKNIFWVYPKVYETRR